MDVDPVEVDLPRFARLEADLATLREFLVVMGAVDTRAPADPHGRVAGRIGESDGMTTVLDGDAAQNVELVVDHHQILVCKVMISR